MKKRVLKLDEHVKIWNETVVVRSAGYDFDCDKCHFSRNRGYHECPHILCKQKINGKHIYFETPRQ
jgi:hypothetical protein